MSDQSNQIVPDSEHKGIVGLLPVAARPFALLARFDRPIGWWLLFWPCAWGVALAGGAIERWDLLLWLLVGSIAMRGAGCVYNDIVDRDLDRQVERTRSRPLASGVTSLKAAWIWLGILCLIGLLVWLQISWGALVGWLAIAPQFHWAMVLLYLGSIFLVIGYDTIYALQDKEDDAMVGIRSSALRLGDNVRSGVLLFYLAALGSWAAAFWMLRPQWLGLVALVPVGLHLFWQVATLKSGDGDDALAKFRSNRFAGLLMFLACLVLGQAG